MSEKKKGRGRQLAKVPLRAVFMPVNIAVPKTVRKNQRYFIDMLKGAHAVPCPFCAEGHLLAVNEINYSIDDEDLTEEALKQRDKLNDLAAEERLQIWQCNLCEDHVTTKTNNVKEVVAHIQRKGRQLYESGYAYQKRQEEIESGMLAMHVDKRASYSKFFYAIALILIFPFLYGAAVGKLLYSLSILLFGILFLFMGIANSYRAWQLYTDNVFPADPKGQFHWWFKNKNWFVSPTNGDVNETYPPEDSEYIEYEDEDDGEYDEYDEYQEYNTRESSEMHYSDYDEAQDTTYDETQGEVVYRIPDFSKMTFYYIDTN